MSKNSKINEQNKISIRKLTRLALFSTLAIAIYGLESLLPPIVPIPGIKPGFSNIITLVLLKNYSARDTLMVVITRIFLSALLFGQMLSMIYSLAGGLLCFLVMVIINRLLNGNFLYLTSIMGAIFHNIGQIVIAVCITRTLGVWSYFPFLMISAILTGLFTGLCAMAAQKYILSSISKQN